MRNDLFRDKKGVHVKLTKTTHSEFRKKLFDLNLTMQASFEEFAHLVAVGDRRATKILEDIALKVAQKEISKYRQEEKAPVDTLDHETLYHLIGKDEESEETSTE